MLGGGSKEKGRLAGEVEERLILSRDVGEVGGLCGC